MPSILEQLLPASAERFRPYEPMDRMAWIEKAGFEVDGRGFDLNTVPYMREIFEDDSPELVAEKGSQIGFTVWSLSCVLHGADELGERWIYYLPTDDESDEFVADRVNTTIRGSEYLAPRIGDTDTKGLKKIGYRGGVAYFRGLWSKRKAKSVPTDGIVFDEVDEHKPELVALANDRNLMSLNPRTLYLSIPSFTRYGIDAKFQETDQRYYLVKCPSCGEWANVDKDFPHNFLPVPKERAKSFPDGTTHYRGCRWCGAQLDMSAGTWVPEFKERRIHGYHVSQLLRMLRHPAYPNVATYLMDLFEKHKGDEDKQKRWFRAIRGLPFDGQGARINDALLLSLEREGVGFLYSASGTIMGVDQANALHVSIYFPLPGKGLQLIYCERALAWPRVHELFRRYGCYVGVTDRVPGLHEARGFAAAFKGRVIVQDFSGDDFVGEGDQRKRRIKEDLHEGTTTIPWVSVDRTSTLDATVDFVEGGRLILPDRKELEGKDLVNYEEYCLHLIDLKWKFEETPSGKRRVYLKNANHHGMGLNSGRLGAFELNMKQPGPDVGLYGLTAPGIVGHA